MNLTSRQKNRFEDNHAKKLNDLFVAYVYSCHEKKKKEKKAILEQFNRDWVDHCYSVNKIIGGTTLNPLALTTLAKDLDSVKRIQIGLGLPKEKTLLEKLLS